PPMCEAPPHRYHSSRPARSTPSSERVGHPKVDRARRIVGYIQTGPRPLTVAARLHATAGATPRLRLKRRFIHVPVPGSNRRSRSVDCPDVDPRLLPRGLQSHLGQLDPLCALQKCPAEGLIAHHVLQKKLPLHLECV